MKEIISLNTPFSIEIAEDGESAVVNARILREGKFTSGINGQTFDITNKHLIGAKDNYNGKLIEFVKSIFRNDKLPNYDLQYIQMAPISIEHQVHAEKVVGRVLGKLWLEDDKSNKTIWLCAKFHVLGKDNVQKAKDGRYKAVSINFNTETFELTEISFVAYGAVPEACILSRNDNSQENAKLNQIDPKVTELLNKIKNKDKTIDICYNKMAQLRKDISLLENKENFTCKLQGLVKDGIITKADMKRVISTTNTVNDNDTLDTVSAVLSKLPKKNYIAKLYSSDDSDFKELIMSDKNKDRKSIIEEMVASINAKFNKSHDKNKKYANDGEAPSTSGYNSEKNKENKKKDKIDDDENGMQTNFNREGGQILINRDHLNHMNDLIDAKDMDGIKDMVMAYQGDDYEDKISKIMNKSALKIKESRSKKEAGLKDAEEELEKEKKEKAELSAQLDALTAALSKVLN